MTDTIFLVFAVMSIASAIAVVTWRNPVHCVLALIASFAGVAGLFYLLSAPFIAVMQIIIYAGAIIVLFLFVIMLLNLKKNEMGGETPVKYRLFTAFLCVITVIILSIPVVATFTGTFYSQYKEKFPKADPNLGTTETIGQEIFAAHTLPFELISILIIAALIGAIYLAKKRQRG